MNNELYDWYCDNCDAHLNNQLGFTSASGKWICSKCGHTNDVSEGNVLNELGQEIEKSLFYHCPRCDAHLKKNGDMLICPDCNFKCTNPDG